jgi:hypothetical protein
MLGIFRVAAQLVASKVVLSSIQLVVIVLFIRGDGVEPSPLLLRPVIGPLYQLWMIDDDDCGAISGMNEWQVLCENLPQCRSVHHWPHMTSLGLETGLPVGSQRITAQATAWSS